MRKVIFGINQTIDGCCDHTKLNGNDEIFEYFAALYRDVDLFVFGRKTYQLMIPYWPDIAKNHSGTTKAMDEFSRAFDSVEHIIVFSRSLDKAEGKNTRILRGSPKEEILKWKHGKGKNISIGGVNLLSQLLEPGIIDEFHFILHPIIAGEGRRLLDGINLLEIVQLKLVASNVFDSGCVALRYLKK